MENSSHRLTRFNVILAFCFIAIGLLANPWLLGYLLQRINFSLQTMLFIGAFEIFFITTGLLLYFKGNTPQERKHLAFGYIAAVLVVLLIETGLHITDLVIHRGEQQGAVFEVCLLSPYEGKEWAEAYWQEVSELRSDYEPFLGWDREEYHGEYINIDSEGVRKTWNPEHAPGEVQNTLYVFGGSTAWGIGARDDYTIPSHLSKLLDNSGYEFAVYNYGETAYTFTQEIIHLALLLREGHRPDYVIFYDGINDVYAAYQSGVPGSTQNVSFIKEQLKAVLYPPSVWQQIAGRAYLLLREQSMIYRAVGKISALFSPEFSEVAARYNDEELQVLSDGIVEQYIESMGLLDHLAQAYGFKYTCFWQPVIFTEEKLTDEEATVIDPRLRDKALSQCFRNTDDSLTAKSLPYFFNISDALDDRTKTYYIDFAHLSEEGNEVVATRIFHIFEEEFLQE